MRCAMAFVALAPTVAMSAPVETAYQGRLLDALGDPVEGSKTITLTLYEEDPEVVLWRRAYTDVAVTSGYFTVALGGSGSVGGVLDSSHFATADTLGIRVGSADELTPRQPLGVVPVAATALSLDGAASGLVLGTTATCDGTNVGALRFDTGRLQICSGGSFVTIATASATGEGVLEGGDGVRTWADGSLATSCYQYRHPTDAQHTYTGDTGSGLYRIQPTGQSPIEVRCDMDLEGGGWTLVGKFNLVTLGNGDWRNDADVNLGFLNSPDNDQAFGAGHLSRARVERLLLDSNDRRLMTYVKRHSDQAYKYCWNQYNGGIDSNWSFIDNPRSNGFGSCGRFGWGYGYTCGVTATSCASYDANYSMEDHWMHANGLNTGTIAGIVQTYCGDNSTSGIGQSASATDTRRGTCYLWAR